MKLTYNGVNLASLGTLRVLSHGVSREPAEAPQRERVTYRFRLDFFENTWRDNYGLIQQLRSALTTQQATLLWQDEDGSTYLNRTVTAAADDSPEDANAYGTYHQGLTFTFWYYNHAVASNCLAANFTGKTGAALDLGAVERWQERLDITRWSELRAARKLVQGKVTASGRLQGDTTQPLATRRNALLAAKDALIAAMLNGAEGTLRFATFNRLIRVTQFQADVDQPHNMIRWSLSVQYTLFPDEADYAWLDLRIIQRENHEEGVPRLTLSGHIGSPSLAQAQTRLGLLKGSLIPDGYVTLNEETGQSQQTAESDANTGSNPTNQGDGTIFIELSFTVETRDSTGKQCTFTTGTGPAVDLGTVDRFREGYAVTLMDDMRSQRKRAGGTVTIGGKWFAADSLAPEDKITALLEQKAAMDAAVVQGSSGELFYGESQDQGTGGGDTPPPAVAFDQVVRVLDWSSSVDRLKYLIDWSLSASWTRFPNESDYALVDLRLESRQDRETGIAIKRLSGRIGAPTAEAAQAKLAKLRALLIPAGYVLTIDNTTQNRLEMESHDGEGKDIGDGATFTELGVDESWQMASGSVLSYESRRVDDQDVRTPWIRTTFSGTVKASGPDSTTALATAEAQAEALGANKYPFLTQSQVTEQTHQVLTDGQVVLTVAFQYEYLRKPSGPEPQYIYTEVTGELSADTFGSTTETVSGFIQAPTLALATATYQADIRNIASYSGALLLNERQLTLSQQRLDDVLDNLASGDARYTFSFQVWRPKTATQAALQYNLDSDSNYQAMEKRTMVTGVCYASSQDVAGALLDTLMGGLSLGKRLRSRRQARQRQGPTVSGPTPATAFDGLEFSEEWIDLLTGISGILECECTEEMTYAGTRLVEKGLPDGPSIIQTPGQTSGQQVITARCVATTETAARAWVTGIRTALLKDGTYEAPPRISSRFVFLQQTAGVARGTGANVKVAEVTGTFRTLLPTTGYPGS